MPKRTRRLDTVAVWNMKVGRGRAAIKGLRQLIRDHNPDTILLQEAMNYVPGLRLNFLNWRIYSGAKPGHPSANCVVMVRKDLPRGRRPRKGFGAVRNHTAWTFINSGRRIIHEGRVWRWVRVDGVHLMSVHRATNALGDNAEAGREEADNLIDWFDSHNGPMIAAGDWNNLWSDKRPNSPRDIAKHVKGELVVPAEARIDYALVRGIDVTAERGDKYGSDHHSHIYRLDRR